ncbi:MAG: hypothetical protein WB502_14525 [Thermoactinomyces sp.]
MVKVCQEHMVDGLKMLDAPHVDILPDTTRNLCCFCSKKAKYLLFLPYIKNKAKYEKVFSLQKGKSGLKQQPA